MRRLAPREGRRGRGQELVKDGRWSDLHRLEATTKHASAGLAAKLYRDAANAQHRAFAQSDDRQRVLLVELLDAGFPGLAHVAGGRVRIEVMGVDLEGDEA